MRIFIHGVDTLLGKALVEELHRRAETGLNRLFGTFNGLVSEAPSIVKRPVQSISSMGGAPDPKKHKKLVDTMQSCKLVIIDLDGCTEDDLLFAITCMKVDPRADPPKQIGEPFEEDITFILVSSVMVWAQTPRPAGGVLTDKDYPTRTPVPGSKYEKWKEMEDMVFRCFNREDSKVKAYIAAPGVLYGDGEAAFGNVFKGAWLGQQDHFVVSPGTNRVPMVHVRDVARLVRQIGLVGPPPPPSEEEPACPYFLAVDQPPYVPPPPPSAPELAASPSPSPSPLPDPVAEAVAEGDAAEGEEEAEGEGAAGDEAADDEAAEEAVAAEAAPPVEADEAAEAAGGGDAAGGKADVLVPKTMPSTQAEIIQGIVDELSAHYDVPTVDTFNKDVADPLLADVMSLDLWIEPTPMMLAEGFAEVCQPPGWWSKDGLVANMRKVAGEFCTKRKLRTMRALIAGPPASGKSELAQAVAEHYYIPHLTLKPNPTDSDIEGMLECLGSKVCRYRGYVLEVECSGYEDMEKLFFMEKPPQPKGEDEEEPPPPPAEEEEDGAEPAAPKPPERVLNPELCPEFIVFTQATQELCRARWKARAVKNGDASGALSQFKGLASKYEESNLSDDSMGISGFFQIMAKKGVLNLPIAGKDQEDILESVRIYMDGSELGRPFNYLPTEQEVADQLLKTLEERTAASLKLAEEEAQRKAADNSGELEEGKNQERRLKIIAQYEAERENLQGLALREYLMRYMVPSLTEGLIEVCKVLPEDPVDYLATYLEEHAATAANAHR